MRLWVRRIAFRRWAVPLGVFEDAAGGIFVVEWEEDTVKEGDQWMQTARKHQLLM